MVWAVQNAGRGDKTGGGVVVWGAVSTEVRGYKPRATLYGTVRYRYTQPLSHYGTVWYGQYGLLYHAVPRSTQPPQPQLMGSTEAQEGYEARRPELC